jgi:maleylacetate reductase
MAPMSEHSATQPPVVRWGLAALPELLDEFSFTRPLLVSTERWRPLELPLQLPLERRFYGALSHADSRGVAAVLALAGDLDCVVGVGGGSAIDTAKAVAAARAVPLISVPTTYSGAEWTGFFGIRDAAARVKLGNAGAHAAAIVYEPALTVGLSREESGGTAINALAHCAEALYVPARSEPTDAQALLGAAAIARWLPSVLDDGGDLEARRGLLEGAMHAGAAMRAGVALGHAMAQSLGGRYGLSHGAMNAVCLPCALAFNAEAAPAEIERFGAAVGTGEPARWVAAVAASFTSNRLRDHGVPLEDIDELAGATAQRPGALDNPRPVTAAELRVLLRDLW